MHNEIEERNEGFMRNNKSIMDIVNPSKISEEDALNIISSLSIEQILECGQNNISVLHIFAANIDLFQESFNYESIVSAIVSKNPEILNLKHQITFENPITK